MSIKLITDLRPGMILKDDIIIKGVKLISKGVKLSEHQIESLYKFDLTKAEFYVEIEAKDSGEAFGEKYAAFSEKTKELFNNFKVGKTHIVDEIKDEVKNMMPTITCNTSIISQLNLIKSDDDYTYRHSVNVCMLSIMLGKWLGYTEEVLEELGVAAILHDVGKLKIPDEILNKPSRLTDMEMEIMKNHTLYGYNILSRTMDNQRILKGIAYHHEKIDGSGYPYGIKGHHIHPYAKIITVCDIFDAMTSKRVYKEKISPFKVAQVIANDSYSTLDPRVSLPFLGNLSQFYMRNLVKLSSGEVGEIIYVPSTDPTRPVVRVGHVFIDLKKEKEIYITEVLDT